MKRRQLILARPGRRRGHQRCWPAAPSGRNRSGPRRSARISNIRTSCLIETGGCCGPMRRYEGRWRLPATRKDVDPRFLKLLFAYEDKRFPAHFGVDPLSLGRAAFQFVANGHIVSGASDDQHAGRAFAGAARAPQPRREAAADCARVRTRARARQRGRSLALSDAGALWRQSRGHSRGIACVFRQGAAQAIACRGRVARCACRSRPELRRPDRFPVAARDARNRVLDRVAVGGRGPARRMRARQARPNSARAQAIADAGAAFRGSGCRSGAGSTRSSAYDRSASAKVVAGSRA